MLDDWPSIGLEGFNVRNDGGGAEAMAIRADGGSASNDDAAVTSARESYLYDVLRTRTVTYMPVDFGSSGSSFVPG